MSSCSSRLVSQGWESESPSLRSRSVALNRSCVPLIHDCLAGLAVFEHRGAGVAESEALAARPYPNGVGFQRQWTQVLPVRATRDFGPPVAENSNETKKSSLNASENEPNPFQRSPRHVIASTP